MTKPALLVTAVSGAWQYLTFRAFQPVMEALHEDRLIAASARTIDRQWESARIEIDRLEYTDAAAGSQFSWMTAPEPYRIALRPIGKRWVLRLESSACDPDRQQTALSYAHAVTALRRLAQGKPGMFLSASAADTIKAPSFGVNPQTDIRRLACFLAFPCDTDPRIVSELAEKVTLEAVAQTL